MSHFVAGKTRSEATPKEWLKIGAQMGDLANKWAKRGDIVAYVGPGAGGPSPACFKPSLAEMEVNVDVAFGDGLKPESIGDISQRRTQFEHPVAMGAVLHEAMHARHSTWSLEELGKHKDRQEAKLVELFEETRIEARGVTHYPRNRSFLRACALKLVIGDLNKDKVLKGGVMGLSQLMLLTCARVDAGVLDKDDATFVKDEAVTFLGKPLYKKLRKIWIKAQEHDRDGEWLPLQKLAAEWIKLLKDAGHDTEPETVPSELKAMLAAIMGELGDAAEETEIEARSEGHITAVIEMAEEAAAEAAAKATEEKDHKDTFDRVFSKSTTPMASGSTGSRLVKRRPPSGPERAAAVTVAKLLEKARYVDRVVVERSSELPPGRLRGRTAIQGAAERSHGRTPTAEPWRRKQRFHVEDPELKVGIMVDISGSMSSAMEPMAVTAWVMSEAVRRIQGRAAMVYYGNSVFPVLKPGQHLDEVNVYTAPDGTERFDQAFKALDGALGLLHGSGARLLVIVSDICYTYDEMAACKRWIKRLHEAGVAVIVLPFDDGTYAKQLEDVKGASAHVIVDVLDPAGAAKVIGQTAAGALEKVSASRNR